VAPAGVTRWYSQPKRFLHTSAADPTSAVGSPVQRRFPLGVPPRA
jgi:hypothetical protein